MGGAKREGMSDGNEEYVAVVSIIQARATLSSSGLSWLFPWGRLLIEVYMSSCDVA
jgi:hypothetical protein